MHSLANMSKKVPAWSREFDALIRAIGECKSKAEEDQIIQREVEVLKPRLKAPSIEKKALKELLVRLLYVEMLGHDASWGHVKALQACSETNLLVKKVCQQAPVRRCQTVSHKAMHDSSYEIIIRCTPGGAALTSHLAA